MDEYLKRNPEMAQLPKTKLPPKTSLSKSKKELLYDQVKYVKEEFTNIPPFPGMKEFDIQKPIITIPTNPVPQPYIQPPVTSFQTQQYSITSAASGLESTINGARYLLV